MTSAERSLRVEAVVLRHSDWGEADRLLVIYTRERGKLRAIAKGVRKMRSRKAGHLQPFTRVSLMLARGRSLWIVTQAESIDLYLPIRDDLERTGNAAYVLELLDRFGYEEEQNPLLFHLLVDTLERITNEEDLFPAVHYYEIRILDLMGFRPVLFHCADCEEEIKPIDQFFSAEQGGVLCPKCGAKDPSARPISMLALKYLRHYQRSSYQEARRARIAQGVRREMEAILQYYLTYLLERKLNTPNFIREVRRLKNSSSDS